MRTFLILGVVTPSVRRLGFHHNGCTAPARCAEELAELLGGEEPHCSS